MKSTLKSKFMALATLLVAFTGTASAQDYSFGWNPRSGDVWVDSTLNDVNRYGSRYREPFIDEIVRYHGAPRDLVSDLLVRRNWAPGDVYYACAIASVIGRPCRYVVDEWDRDHGQGWGNVAQRLGIKPGSAEFHRLKRGFVPTYDRWARPIPLDDDLRGHYPNRGKAGASDFRGKPGKGSAAADRGPGQSSKGRSGDHGRAAQAKGRGAHAGPGNATGGKGNAAGKGNAGKSGKGNNTKGDKGNGKGGNG